MVPAEDPTDPLSLEGAAASLAEEEGAGTSPFRRFLAVVADGRWAPSSRASSEAPGFLGASSESGVEEVPALKVALLEGEQEPGSTAVEWEVEAGAEEAVELPLSALELVLAQINRIFAAVEAV